MERLQWNACNGNDDEPEERYTVCRFLANHWSAQPRDGAAAWQAADNGICEHWSYNQMEEDMLGVNFLKYSEVYPGNGKRFTIMPVENGNNLK